MPPTRSLLDLHELRPWRGIAKSLGQLALLAGLAFFTLTRTTPLFFLPGALACGLLYFTTHLLSHDCIHVTLSGVAWYDQLFARVVSYPGLWLHGVYREVHLLHHRMNGLDLRDPERRQPTRAEYEAAGRLRRYYLRYAWAIDLGMCGGFGMMLGLARQGWRLRASPGVRRALWIDGIGILTINGALCATAYHYGVLARFVALFLVVERVAGTLNQVRSRIEHHGLWARAEGDRLEIRALSSRNVETSRWVSLFFHRLNFHSVHHAYPKIPYYHLEAAHRWMAGRLAGKGRALPSARGYAAAVLSLARGPQLIQLR